MFLLVPAYPGCPGQMAVKWLLLLYYRTSSDSLYVYCTANVLLFSPLSLLQCIYKGAEQPQNCPSPGGSNTQCIATLPEKDRATAIGNTYKNFVKTGHVAPEICSHTHTCTHAHTHTHGHHNRSLPYRGQSNNKLHLILCTAVQPKI